MPWNPKTFHRWLIFKAHITDDPVGDFIKDSRDNLRAYPHMARSRAFLPLHKVRSLDGLQRVMRNGYPGLEYRDVHACLPDVWKRYEQWRDDRGPRET